MNLSIQECLGGLDDYEAAHGFDKTKAMVEFYSCIPIWNTVTVCNDCGKPTETIGHVRCDSCREKAWAKFAEIKLTSKK